MKMQLNDIDGSLYSFAGLRFGGFSTLEFLAVTEDLEKKRSGIREEIIAEAHYLAIWPHRFPEIAFLFALIAWRSILIAIISLVTAQVIETFRFYFFGPSTTISYTCKFWQFVKFPLYLIAAILIWPANYVISLLLIVFIILQCWLGLVTNMLTMPIRFSLVVFLSKLAGHSHAFQEALALQFVIDRWKRHLNMETPNNGINMATVRLFQETNPTDIKTPLESKGEKVKEVTVEKLADILIGQWGLTKDDLGDTFLEILKTDSETKECYEEILCARGHEIREELKFLYLFIIILSVKMVFNEEETVAIVETLRDNFFLKIDRKVGNSSFSQKWLSRKGDYTKAFNLSHKIKDHFLAVGTKFAELCKLGDNKSIAKSSALFFLKLLNGNLELLKSHKVVW